MVAVLSTADCPSSGIATVKAPPAEEQVRAEAEVAAKEPPAAVVATW